MAGRKISKDFLDETVKANSFLNKSAILFLRDYGFEVDETKKRYTIRERDEILEILEKLEELEKLKIKGFTPKKCGKLIRMGLYDSLRTCIINGYRIPEFKALEKALGEEKTTEDIKIERKKPSLDEAKISSVYAAVENAGNLNPQEMQVMLKMCGFRVEGKLVPELTNEEEVENSL